jgi:anti-anti-sigma factor
MNTEFNFDSDTTKLTYTFSGRMDGINTKEAEKVVHDGLMKVAEELGAAGNDEEGLKITFDLKSVDFVASSFIRVCLFVAKKIGQPNFSIINTNPHINKTFKVSGLDEALNVS